MKKKILRGVLASLTALTGTVTLATFLSLIPTKEKTLKQTSEVKQKQKKDVVNTLIPSLPSGKQSETIRPNHKTTELISLSDRKYSSLAIAPDQKISYVALGDSITAGFVARLDKDYPGKFENGQVHGLSYPAYLAQMFQQINRLQSFENFAVTGSTFADWNILLKSRGQEANLTQIELALMRKRFTANWKQKYTNLVQQLNKSNLITVSLGANDFMKTVAESIGSFPISEIVKVINSQNANYSEITRLLSELFNTLFTNIQQRQDLFIKQLRALAPKANINFIGFPTPLSMIFDMLDRHINKYSDNKGISISSILIDLVNKKIKFTANSNKTYFINPFDHDYWIANHKVLVNTLFDIHPGARGYKKIAQDIFIKLINPSRDQAELIKHGINWDKKYIQSDQESFLTQIQTTQKPFEIIDKIFGNDKDAFIVAKDNLYDAQKNKLSQQNYFRRVLNSIAFEEIVFEQILPTLLQTKFYRSIDPDQLLSNFLNKNNKENLKSLKKWFKDSNIVANLLQNVEQAFWNTDWDKDGLPGAKDYRINYLAQAFRDELGNEQRIIGYIFSLTQTSVFTKHLAEFKQIVKTLLTNLVAHDFTTDKVAKLVNLFYKPEFAKVISRSDVEKLILLALNSETLKQNVADIIENIIADSKLYATSQSFEDLWFKFIRNEKNTASIKNIFTYILKDFVAQPEFKHILARIGSNLVHNFPQYFANIDPDLLGEFSADVLNLWTRLDSQFNLVEIISNSLISQLQSKLPNKFSVEEFGKQTFGALASHFDSQNIEQTVLNLIKSASQSKIAKYKPILKTLLSNLLQYSKQNSHSFVEFINSIYSKLGTNIEAWISRDNFTQLINKTIKFDEFGTLIESVIDAFASANEQQIQQANNLYELIRTLFVNDANVVVALNNLVAKILELPELNPTIAKGLSLLPIQTDQADIDSLKNLAKTLLKNEDFLAIERDFIDNVLLSPIATVENFDFNANIKNWLANEQAKSNLKQNLTKLAINITKNTHFIEIIANISKKYHDSQFPNTNNVTKEQFVNLYSTLLADLENFNNETNLINDLINLFVDELATNGTQLDLNALIQNILATLTKATNSEEKIVNIVKYLAKNNILTQNKELISTLISNVISSPQHADSIYNKLYSLLPTNIQTYVAKDKFLTLAQNTFASQQFKNFANNLIDSLASIEYSQIQNQNTIFDILKTSLRGQNVNNLVNSTIDLVVAILSQESFVQIIQQNQKNLPVFIQNINVESLINLSKDALRFEGLKPVLASFINDAIFNNETTLDKILDFDFLLKKWLQNEQNEQNLAQQVPKLIISFSQNQNLIDVLATLAHDQLQNYGAQAQNITKDELKQLIQAVLTQIEPINNSTQIFNTLSAKLVEQIKINGIRVDFASVFANLNQQIFSPQNIEANILALFKQLVQSNLLGNNKDVLAKLIIAFSPSLKDYALNSNFLEKALGEKAIRLINPEHTNAIITKLINEPEYAQLITILIELFTTLPIEKVNELNSLNDLIKLLFAQLDQSNIGSHSIALLQKILDYDETSQIYEQIKPELPVKLRFISPERVKWVIKNLLTNQNLRELVKHFIDSTVIEPDFDLTKLRDFNYIVQKWLESDSKREFVASKTKAIIQALIQQPDFADIVAQFAYNELKEVKHLANNINEEEFKNLVKIAINSLSNLENDHHFISTLIDQTLANLSQEGTNVDFSKILQSVVNSVFSSQNIEQSIVKIIKLSLKSPNVQQSKNVLQQLVKNTVSFQPFVQFLAQKTFSLLESKVSQTFTQQIWQQALNAALTSENLAHITQNLFEALFAITSENLDNINTGLDLGAQAWKVANKDQILSDLSQILIHFIDSEQANTILNEVALIIFTNPTSEQLQALKNSFKAIIQQENFKPLLTNFIDNALLTQGSQNSDFTDFNIIIKRWFNSQENKQQIITKLSTLVQSLLSDSSIKELLAYLLFPSLQSESITIEKVKSFVNDVAQKLINLETSTQLIQKTATTFVDELALNGKNIDLSSAIFTLLKSLFTQGNSTIAFNIVKETLKDDFAKKHVDILKFSINKLLIYAKDTDAVWTSIYELMGVNAKNTLTLEQFSSLNKKVLASQEFSGFVDKVIQLLTQINTTNIDTATNIFELVKLVFKDNVNTELIQAISNVAKFVLQQQEFDPVITKLITKLPTSLQEIELNSVKNLFNFALDNQNFKTLLTDFINKGLFNEQTTTENISDFASLIQRWFNQNQSLDNIKENIKNLFVELSTNPDFATLVATIGFAQLKSNNLATNITFEEFKPLVVSALANLSHWENNTNLLSQTINTFIDKFVEQGTSIDLVALANSIATTVFTGENAERNIVGVLKVLANAELLQTHKEVLIKLLKNTIEWANTNVNIAQSIYSVLDEKTKTEISKYMSVDEFKVVINDTLAQSSTEIAALIEELMNIAIANSQSIDAATTALDLVNVILKSEQNEQVIATNLETILLRALKHEKIFNLLNGLWKQHISPYGVNTESAENVKFARDLFEEIPELMHSLGVVPSIIKAVKVTATEHNTLTEFGANFTQKLLKTFDLTNYKHIQILLRSKTLAANKDTLKAIILKIVESITTQDEQLLKFAQDFGLTSGLIGAGLTEKDAHDTVLKTFKSDELKQVLTTFLDEIFQNSEEYARLTSWPDALVKFFNSTNADVIKRSLKSWIKKSITEQNNLTYALGKILANTMRKGKIALPNEEDIKVQKFIDSFAKQAVNTQILDNIVDELFNTLKSINRYPLSELSTKLQEAFKKGALKFISADDGTIMLGKIFDNMNVFSQILSNIDGAAYVDFVNLIFKYSPKSFNEGIYGIMFAKKGSGGNGGTKFNATSGFGGILKGKVSQFIKIFVEPMVKQFYKELTDKSGTYNSINELKQNSAGYQSLWRFYAFIAQIMYENTPSGLFWNATNTTSEAMIMDAYMQSFRSQAGQYPDLTNKYSGDKLEWIGLQRNKQPLNYYISGLQIITWGWSKYNSRANGLRDYFYGRDHTLAYIYWGDSPDKKYNSSKKLKEVLLDDMIKGYQPVDTK
ncbi:SGNH/GDSL hydrolase family protein [Mycoplasma simbae]|uniref:SGNH/GDSL hydrolase family protein n=1 Tax=Mycoplasma simbae TaxID=36744 RepID=UPI000495D045|nr:SGNH/GDSL hydrolase family protein [Mycoplasma simbae]